MDVLGSPVPNRPTVSVDVKHHSTITVSRFGLAVRRYAGKQKDLGSVPFRLSFLLK